MMEKEFVTKLMYQVWYIDTDGSDKKRIALFETKALAMMTLEKMKIDGLQCGLTAELTEVKLEK